MRGRQGVRGMRQRVNEAAAPAAQAGLDGREGLDVGVGGERRGHLDLTGQQVRVSGARRGRRVFVPGVRVCRGGGQHHAVELGDVGSEAVHHAADLVHQRTLGLSPAVVHGDQAAVVPGDDRAAAGTAATAAAAAAADAAWVLWNAGHLRLLPISRRQPLADRADRRGRLRPVGDRVALLCFRELVQGLVCDRVRVTGQGGHGGEGGQGDVRGQVPAATVTLLRGLGEGLDDGSLIVLLLLDVEGQPLPQVAATGTAALRLRPRHRFTVGAGGQEGGAGGDRGGVSAQSWRFNTFSLFKTNSV